MEMTREESGSKGKAARPNLAVQPTLHNPLSMMLCLISGFFYGWKWALESTPIRPPPEKKGPLPRDGLFCEQ